MYANAHFEQGNQMNVVERFLKHDRWAGASGEREAGPFILRFRTPVLESDETGVHANQLLVVWAYAEEGTGALPSSEDQERMSAFEERLCEAWEGDGLAVLTAVLTFDGARQWVFYASDVGECGKRLNDMPLEAEPYPIKLTTEPDPGWDYLREQILLLADWREHQAEWRREFGKFL